MKSSPHNLGNLNMHGKKSAGLNCGCCDAYDFREEMRALEDRKEMAAALRGDLDGASHADQPAGA